MSKIEWNGRKFGDIDVIFYNFESVLAIRNNSIKIEDDFTSMWKQLIYKGVDGSLDLLMRYYKPNNATKRFIDILPKDIKHVSIAIGNSSIASAFQDSFLKEVYSEYNPFLCNLICDGTPTKIMLIEKYIKAFGIGVDKVLVVCASQNDAEVYARNLGVQVITTEEIMNV